MEDRGRTRLGEAGGGYRGKGPAGGNCIEHLGRTESAVAEQYGDTAKIFEHPGTRERLAALNAKTRSDAQEAASGLEGKVAADPGTKWIGCNGGRRQTSQKIAVAGCSGRDFSDPDSQRALRDSGPEGKVPADREIDQPMVFPRTVRSRGIDVGRRGRKEERRYKRDREGTAAEVPRASIVLAVTKLHHDVIGRPLAALVV